MRQIVLVRIVSEAFLRQTAIRFPRRLRGWSSGRMWRGLAEVRQAYPHADAVKVRSGRIVTVFNVCGNNTASF